LAAQKKNPNAHSEGKKPPAAQAKKAAGLPEGARNALFALLAIAAIGAAAYVFFILPSSDTPADGQEFLNLLVSSSQTGIIYDVRESVNDKQRTNIYQCGVDMIFKGRFVGKNLTVIACDIGGCLASLPSGASKQMTYEQAQKEVSSMPYFIIKAGKSSSHQFFRRHMEITLGPEIANWTGCDISYYSATVNSSIYPLPNQTLNGTPLSNQSGNKSELCPRYFEPTPEYVANCTANGGSIYPEIRPDGCAGPATCHSTTTGGSTEWGATGAGETNGSQGSNINANQSNPGNQSSGQNSTLGSNQSSNQNSTGNSSLGAGVDFVVGENDGEGSGSVGVKCPAYVPTSKEAEEACVANGGQVYTEVDSDYCQLPTKCRYNSTQSAPLGE
jgi:hypothetical protein